MKTSLLPVGALTLGLCLPLFAQTGAGTPPITTGAPLNRPIPQKLLLPTSSDQTGTITTDKASYPPGQTVAITFTVANPTKTAATYNFPTGQKFDISVLDTKGNTLWQWSRGQTFTPGLSRVSLAPGQKLTFHTLWNGRDESGKPVAPGLYTVNAHLTSTSGMAITGGVLVNPDTDPNNMGVPTKTPADTGAIRQVDTTPPVTASKRIAIGVLAPDAAPKK